MCCAVLCCAVVKSNEILLFPCAHPHPHTSQKVVVMELFDNVLDSGKGLCDLCLIDIIQLHMQACAGKKLLRQQQDTKQI